MKDRGKAERDERIADLGRDLPYSAPDPDRLKEIRNALGSFDRRPQARNPWRARLLGGATGVAVALAAALAIVLSIQDRVAPPPRSSDRSVERALVHPDTGARFVHTGGTSERPERVKLESGALWLEVERLGARERFVVETDDAEIEVRATELEVAADRGSLASVKVVAGVVEIHRAGRSIVLHSGQSWTPGERASSEAHALPRSPGPAPKSRRTKPKSVQATLQQQSAPPPVAATSSSAIPLNERAFRDAWAAFAAGDMATAAALFAEAEAVAPDASLAEDASYGRALALERAGRRSEAMREMRRFLRNHPRSVRADEVSLALGWLVLDIGEIEEARALFERAARSPVERVRISAEGGVDAVSAPR